MAFKRKLVALVSLEVFTPYKLGEVFCVPEEDAVKLLTKDLTKNEYGVPRYPKVKCRPFNPDLDGDLLLSTGSLNLDDHNVLLKSLHPDRPEVEVRMTQYESEITNLLDGIEPNRSSAKKSKSSEPADSEGSDKSPISPADSEEEKTVRRRRTQ